MMRRRLTMMTGVAAAGLVAGLGVVQWHKAGAQTRDWIGSDMNGLHYAVMLPSQYDSARSYPVVLYLHQLDMGNDRDGLLKQVDAWFNTAAFRSSHQAIVVVPMLDQRKDLGGKEINFGGKRDGHAGEDNTIAALKQVIARYHIDTNRVYVTGNSMGGMGTWQMLLDYNMRTGTKGRIFAAGMPVAGAHRTAEPAAAAAALGDVPVWVIHGAEDREVSLDWDRAMARLLSGHRTFRYTEVPDAGHDVWDAYYSRPDVWDWLFAQRGVQ
jgi:predicted peptidase